MQREQKLDLVNIEKIFSQSPPWGLSTWIDLRDCEKELITSSDSIKKFVIELCDLLEVRRMGEPCIIDFGREERVKGYSLTQLIETSLVSAHFVNLNCSAYIDIFSCKYYDPQKAFEHCLRFFNAQSGSYDIKIRK